MEVRGELICAEPRDGRSYTRARSMKGTSSFPSQWTLSGERGGRGGQGADADPGACWRTRERWISDVCPMRRVAE